MSHSGAHFGQHWKLLQTIVQDQLEKPPENMGQLLFPSSAVTLVEYTDFRSFQSTYRGQLTELFKH